MTIFNLGLLGRFKVQCIKDDTESLQLQIEGKRSESPDVPLSLRIRRPGTPATVASSPSRAGALERSSCRPPPQPQTITQRRTSSVSTVVPPPSYSLLPPFHAEPCSMRQRSSQNLRKQWKVREVQWYNSVLAPSPTCPNVRLRRYIMEIIALNVQADFRALNIALYGYNQWGQDSSILSPSERIDLLDLARYVQGLHEDFKLGKTIEELKLGRYHREIVDAYREFSPWDWPLFAVDVLAWYAESVTPHAVRVPWLESGVADVEIVHGEAYTSWEPRESVMSRMMQGFDFLIRKFSINEEVQLQFNEALERCNRRQGFEELEPRENCHLIRMGMYLLMREVLDEWLDARKRERERQWGPEQGMKIMGITLRP